ncbi:MAG: glutamate--cysteine ligase [Pseudomonadota bacterium]
MATSNYAKATTALANNPDTLGFRRGVERETLRVDLQGNLARTPHPAFLGSKLTHPSITTDFSESQLELITPVANSIDETLATLDEVHRFVAQGLSNEVLWSASMPCVLQGDNTIPLAMYGSSNLARLKTTYRHGLGQRYGRAMQTICAVHYNFSFPDSFWTLLASVEGELASKEYKSRRYFDLMRNFRQLSWLPVYLFGASPAVCNSFVKGREHNLVRFDEGSLYAPGATSLRSGNLGYQSDTQGGMLHICYNSLENYVSTLARAICTPHEPYLAAGVKVGNEYLQVNGNVLQSEAEFYTTIRAKCVPPKGENFLRHLKENGVEYLEVRLLDVNPYLPTGIDATQIRFLDLLLLHCLLTPSPEHDDERCNLVNRNLQRVVWEGRNTSTMLDDGDTTRSVPTWGLEVIAALQPLAELLDRDSGNTAYAESLKVQQQKLNDTAFTPSSRVLEDMRAESIPFFRFAMNKAMSHTAGFVEAGLPKDRLDYFKELSRESVEAQHSIEAQDNLSFGEYLTRINAAYQDLF